MRELLQKYWAVLPILSAVLIMAAFYPLRLLTFAFVALTPLFYFLHSYEGEGMRRVFFANFLFGIIFSLSLSYTSLIQFHWFPEAYAFTWFVKFLVVPITLASGIIGGCVAILYVRLRSQSALFNVILLPVLWVIGEGVFNAMLGGYHLGMLAYAVSPVPQLVQFAAIGGVLFVSFLVALMHSFIAAFAYAFFCRNARAMRMLCGFAIGVFIFLAGGHVLHDRYIAVPAGGEKSVSIAIIQNADRTGGAFGTFDSGGFAFPHLERLIADAALQKPDIIIYPFSPFVGAITENEARGARFDKDVLAGSVRAFGEWERKTIPFGTAFITWNTVFRDHAFFNEFDAWKDGEMAARYQKRSLFPFMDYTPRFAQNIGLYSTPFDAEPGPGAQASIDLLNHRFESLMCSEVRNTNLVDPVAADIILSLGSDAMFAGDVVGYNDLINAQYRAAEYGIPSVRGNRFGPSALIDKNGTVIRQMAFGQEGVLYGVVSHQAHGRTLYSRIGDWGFRGFSFLCISAALFGSIRKRRGNIE